jgi:hypothetical protein|tara:strand:- start:44 stop:400 length:357 start_codon:yes stop_codon:yes gene_type:complete
MARPKKDVMQLARRHTTSAVQTLAGLMTNKSVPAAARIQAASVILDRGHGKAAITMDSNAISAITINLVDLGPGVRQAGDRLVAGPGIIEGKTEIEPVDPLKAVESGIEQTVNKGETP